MDNTKIKWLDVIRQYNIFKETYYVKSGDIGSVIAARKFYELSNLINNANFSIEQAKNSDNLNRKSYFLRYAILDYNACYDYLLQIIYFAFDFFPDFDYASTEEFRKILKDKCRLSCLEKIDGKLIYKDTEFAEDIKKLKDSNPEFAEFYKRFNKFKAFVEDENYGIKQWANNIKHQGGFCFKELLTPSGHTVAIASFEVVFTTRILTPYTPTMEEAITRLHNQNRNIIEFSNWLFEYIYGDISHIDFVPRQKLFTAQKHQFNKMKLSNVYATK